VVRRLASRRTYLEHVSAPPASRNAPSLPDRAHQPSDSSTCRTSPTRWRVGRANPSASARVHLQKRTRSAGGLPEVIAHASDASSVLFPVCEYPRRTRFAGHGFFGVIGVEAGGSPNGFDGPNGTVGLSGTNGCPVPGQSISGAGFAASFCR